MNATSFTNEQKQAIYTLDKNILVAAAAGSGKTAVLVERIINLITDQTKPIAADKLVVVTFTKAAANEMRQRISKALLTECEKEPNNEYLQRQVILLNKAHISTMDSFCINLIRKYFYLLDIDPGFKIIDPTEEKLIKIEILDNIFEDEYANESNQIFLDLIESYGGSRTKDDGLSKLIFKIYNLISNIPWPKDWLSEKTEMFNIKNNMVLEDTFWFDIIKNQVITTLNYILDSIDYAIEISKSQGGPNQYLENLFNDKELVLQLSKTTNLGYEKMYETFKTIDFQKLTSKNGEDVDPELKNIVNTIRDKEIKKNIFKLRDEVFIKTYDNLIKDIKSLYPIFVKLQDLVIKFSKEYKEEKNRRNLIDFNDAQHYCLQILAQKKFDENGEIIYSPTKIAIDESENFEQIMIDEYQDSNLMQELIFSSLSKKEKPNRFMVGDIKQSIYRFRGANPDVFLEKYDVYTNDGDDQNIRVDLFKNFRSKEIVLNSVNFFFYQLMNKEIGKIGYDEKVALYSGVDFPETTENISSSTDILLGVLENKSSMENHVLEEIEEMSRLEIEGEIIASKIKEMTQSENPLMVLDKDINGYRAATYSDIVIIMRSVTSGETLAHIFKNHGIPIFVDSKSGYFDSIEVSTILSFLQIIDNPRQDLHIIAVLRSPVYLLSSDELLEIRNIRENGDFYGCILEYLEISETEIFKKSDELVEKLKNFMSDLEKWRDDAINLSISSLLSKLFDDTNYLNYLGVMPSGEVRQANLNILLEKAIYYEDTSLKGLFHFIKYVEKLQKTKSNVEIAKISTEKENLVRLMTIHKSKGLEFPIVFFSMLGKKFNTEDRKEQVLLHQKYGFGPSHINLEERIKSKTIAKIALSYEIHKENIAEEMRMFYVATTRAKEKLILTGCVKDIENKINNGRRYSLMPENEFDAHFLLKSESYLDWVLASLARHKDGGILRKERECGKLSNEFIYNFPTNFNIKLFTKEDIKSIESEGTLETEKLYTNLKEINNNEDYSGMKEEIIEKFSFIYPFIDNTKLPTKISISEIKRLHQKELIDNYTELNIYDKPIFNEPKFLAKPVSLTKQQIGTITHTVMEHLDFQKTKTRKDLEQLVSLLVKNNILNQEESLVVPIDKILNFTNSGLAKRMRESKMLKKESTFVMGLSPFEIYKDEKFSDNEATILVHGIIDCFFEENGEMVVVDYKSDHVKNIDYIKSKYKIQLDIYKKAVERSTGMSVKECVLYSFDIDREIIVI